MAVCVGCGLEVNNGLLEVNVCGTPITPNTTTGGLQCDTATENGCLKVVLNDSHAGCGLNASATGQLEFDPCLNGGILCGATDDDPEDNCAYVNVQGQGGGPCTPLATAQTACPSPNCNGLVRTCDGLWAPPKTFGTYGFSLDQDGFPAGPFRDYLIDTPGNIPDLPGTVGDGFAGPGGDFIVTNNPNYELLFHSFNMSDAVLCGMNVYGNTFSTFSMSFFVNAGELWRFLLWERFDVDVTQAQASSPATVAGSALLGTNWSLQASFYVDRRVGAGGPFLETIQMNDVSSSGAGAGGFVRWEYMITAQRLVPGGATNANINNQTTAVGTRQYRLTMNSAHCRPPEASSNAVAPGPIVVFP